MSWLFALVDAVASRSDELALQRRYMTLETLAVVGDNPSISLTGIPVMPKSMTS